MEIGDVESNVSSGVKKMTEQTGKTPGGSTGLCHLVVTTALTGADVNFTVDVTRANQLRLESESGLTNYPITVEPGMLVSDAVETVLQQDKVPIEAFLLTGKIHGKDASHIIAIVQNKEGEYAVVDSLVSNAIVKLSDTEAVAAYINERFDTTTRKLDYSVVLTKGEQSRRTSSRGNQPIQVGRGIFI